MTTHSQHPRTLEIDLPLFTGTHSDRDVAGLVRDILHCIDERREAGRPAHQNDVLQALAIVTALQSARAEATLDAGRDVSLRLLDLQVLPAHRAAPRSALPA